MDMGFGQNRSEAELEHPEGGPERGGAVARSKSDFMR